MKTTKQDFELFKKECHQWIDKLELNNWKIYFEWGGNTPNTYSTIFTKQDSYVGTIYFTKDWEMTGVISILDGIKETAKHEIIHLLLSRFSNYAKSKDYTSADLYEAEEELVRKLERLITK